MRTLYRHLEIDDRAIQDIVALGDETTGYGRGVPQAPGRRPRDRRHPRKVGGLPSGLSIFELGFAGKGRIYYSKGRQRAFRILAVGGKASQKQDLDYLSRLSLD